MKKTEYFFSKQFQGYESNYALQDVIKSRDIFLETNKSLIAKIENEKVEFIYINTNNLTIDAVSPIVSFQ